MGTAIAAALYSAVTKNYIDNKLAMTGEVSLWGKIKPVGGVRAKIEAAAQAGATRVLIPKENWQSEYAGFTRIKVIPVVASVAQARRMEKYGADALVAEGTESGGHIGELTTMTLVPQVCDAVNIPVLAAGGIADGRGIAAALMLGACGVQCGTRFLVAEECTVHQNYKNKILKAKDIDTIATGKRLGHPVRCLRNQMTNAYIAKEKEGADRMELEHFTLGGLRKAVFDGDVKTGSVMAGQVAGMVHEIKPLRQIFEEMTAQCGQTLKTLEGMGL